MPKNEVHKVKIDKDIFLSILEQNGLDVPKIVEKGIVNRSERTLKRAIESGKMRPIYLNAIAQYINIHPSLLSGEKQEEAAKYPQPIRDAYLETLTKEKYPFHLHQLEQLKRIPISELIARILSLFDIPYSQFDSLEFEKQYEIQYELFDSITKVIHKHFKENCFGPMTRETYEGILIDLENYRDEYYLNEYANTTLRNQYLANTPKGMDKRKIKKMSPADLIALDISMTRDLIELTEKCKILELYDIYKQCMYNPTKEKFEQQVDDFLNDDFVKIFACLEGKEIKGVLVISFLEEKKVEIVKIAVAQAEQMQEFGSYMIKQLVADYGLLSVYVETDVESVRFYREIGFKDNKKFKKLSEQSTVIRYDCKLEK